MASNDQDAKAACDDIFNAATTEDVDDIFRSATVATPHKIQLSYSLSLPSSLVSKFPSGPVTKNVSESFTLERKRGANVELCEDYCPREFIHLRSGSYQNGECLVTIKNMSSKIPIELKSPGAGKIMLGYNEEASVKSNTKIAALNLVWMIMTEAGDMDATTYEVSMKGFCSEEFNQMVRAVEDSSSNRVHGEAGVPTPNPQNGPNPNNGNQVNRYRPQTEQYGRFIRNDTVQPMSSTSNGPVANVGPQSYSGNQWQACRNVMPLPADNNVILQAQYQAPASFVGQGGVPPAFCSGCSSNPPCTERSFNSGFCDGQPHESPLHNGPHFDAIPNYGQPYSWQYPSYQPHVNQVYDGKQYHGIPSYGQPYYGRYPSWQPPASQVHYGQQYHGIPNYWQPYTALYPSGQPHACPPNNGSFPGEYRPAFSAAQEGYPGQSGTGSYGKQPTTNWHTVKPTGIDEAVNLSPDNIRQHCVNTHPISENSPPDFNPYLMNEYMRKPE
ncbi:uncharacterized protein LOC126816527 [Patella vulgata]|uniref:uncharacterized protein LOC126816527 n=1 Tax=Patella vulgata TaxID=6465 RepID=UPI0024A8E492|nr:uncharacterized protein LOC126816527 [Patella vulgata]